MKAIWDLTVNFHLQKNASIGVGLAAVGRDWWWHSNHTACGKVSSALSLLILGLLCLLMYILHDSTSRLMVLIINVACNDTNSWTYLVKSSVLRSWGNYFHMNMYVYTVVSRRRVHGWCTLLCAQTGEWADICNIVAFYHEKRPIYIITTYNRILHTSSTSLIQFSVCISQACVASSKWKSGSVLTLQD